MEANIKYSGNRERETQSSLRTSGNNDYSSIPECEGLKLVGGLGLGQRAQWTCPNTLRGSLRVIVGTPRSCGTVTTSMTTSMLAFQSERGTLPSRNGGGGELSRERRKAWCLGLALRNDKNCDWRYRLDTAVKTLEAELRSLILALKELSTQRVLPHMCMPIDILASHLTW